MSRTGGHAVVEALVAEGVEVVFGIPGTHNLEIYRALGESNIRAVTPRHEQGAGYAADAYTRVSGRPGVVVPTTGPGLTNATTAAATAYADSIPMLLISPGMARGLVRMDGGWLHEIKHDGYRLMVRRQGARVRLFTRRGFDWTHRYPAIVEAANHPELESAIW